MGITKLTPRVAQGDLEFVRVAEHGFGDPYNGISHSMAYFAGSVFVGTSRCNMQMIAANHNAPHNWVAPVRCPDNVYDLDRRAQLWRHDRSGKWTRVYTSPAVTGPDGTTVPS